MDNEASGLIAGGVVMGLSIAAPIGPVNLEMIHRGLRQGFAAALQVGVGSTLADLIYIALAYAGADPLSHQAWARVILFGAGAAVLTYLGVGAIRAGLTAAAIPQAEEAAAGTGRGSFSAGFFITILNPMTIAFWLGILSAALAARPREGVVVELAYVLSLVTGCLLWVVSLAAALHYGRRLARGPVLRFVSVAAGLVLIGFGVRFALKAVAAA